MESKHIPSQALMTYTAAVTSPAVMPDPVRPNTRRGSAEVRHALLVAAAELFARKGYAGAGTKEIAAAARTSEASIYRQFGSKVELFGEAVAEPFAAFLAEYRQFFERAMTGEGWTDQLISRQSVERLYRYLRQNKHALLAMITAYGDPEAAEPAERASERFDAFFEDLYAIGLERWRRDPQGFDVDRLRLTHRLLVAMIFCVSSLDRWFVPRGPAQPTEDQLVDAITEFLIRGFVDHAHNAPAAVDPGPAELLDQLDRLAAMKQAGLLTEAEFSDAKAILLRR